MLELIFYILLFLIFYTYFGYPLFLYFISLFANNEIKRKNITPPVTLIISAYNEEKCIRRKIENSLSLNYPNDRLEIIVVSDCSTDKTNDIVLGYKDKGVILLNTKSRCGKSAGLNEALARAQGELIVFSDANSFYSRDALQKLARNFFDTRVGLVTGSTKYSYPEGGTVSSSFTSYSAYERFTKINESKIASCVGADGAIFALRRSLYLQLNNADINDFVIPLQVIQQGYRAVMDDEVFCTEETTHNHTKDFQRQVRITCRTLRSIFSHAEFLNPFRYPLLSFELVSHKLLKFLVPFFLIVVLLVNLLLVNAHVAYRITLFLQLSVYAIALFTFSRIRSIKRFPLISLASYFLSINLAFLIGWTKYLSGEKYITWEHERISNKLKSTPNK